MTEQQLPQEIVVTRVVDVTPRLRRVTFGGPGAAVYLAEPHREPNVKLFFPEAGGAPLELPKRVYGSYVWRAGARERVRSFTIRSIDDAAGEFDVEFVLHGGGVAGSWAGGASIGDAIGVLGGGGNLIGDASWKLLVGDETALPAIAAMIEGFDPEQRGIAIIEVADAAEEQALQAPEGFEVRWLHRDGEAPGSTTLLTDAVELLDFPTASETVRVWVGAESETVRAIRVHLRLGIGFDRREQLIIGYWSRGIDEPTYAADAHNDRARDELDEELSHEI
ncbi:siderophore-interacting protein [Plantibacter sp. Mn2098]|uniref:siderophore-interacting protein n=1 Tax=Plantibacter sp. Mn2098 TaxID=3395266 RepID=UPI003BEA1CAD